MSDVQEAIVDFGGSPPNSSLSSLYELDARARLAASHTAQAGSRLTAAELARASGMTVREYRAASSTLEFRAAVAALLEAAAETASVHAISHRAARVGSLQADFDRTDALIKARAAEADPRYCNADPEWLRQRGVDPDVFLAAFPDAGMFWDPSAPECARVDPELAFVPGADTGLMARDQKTVGRGLDAHEIDVWELDAALLSQRRDILKQAAQEEGQWGPSASQSGPAVKLYIGIDMERL